MPHIAAVATAVPPHVVTQPAARAFAAAHFRAHRRDVERLLPVFDHTGIATRHTCVPPEWFTAPHDAREKNELYIDWSTRLGAEVVRSLAAGSSLSLTEITHIIFVSTTGLATPSIDSRLLNVLGLSERVVRTPIWGLGCAGGAAGLALAHRLAMGDPDAVIALVCVELCSLTFHHADFSKSNFIATALFADGAAGVLVTGDSRPAAGPRILAVGTTTWPGSLEVMGWNFDAVGMQVVFSQAIPRIVRERVRDNTAEFLRRHGRDFAGIGHWIVHPGGTKVMAAYEDALALGPDTLRHARAVLRDCGNMSSPTVLFVLERLLRSGETHPGEYGLLTALGPGFSAENLLLQF